jgi:hypothetical protein
MKHIRKINEIAAKFDRDKNEFLFDPTESGNNTVTFYLHNDKNKSGFAMEIAPSDREKLEEILSKNNINYTVSADNILPF